MSNPDDHSKKKDIIEARKNLHLTTSVQTSVERKSSNTFADIQLEHCALPELSLSEVDPSLTFLGKKISMPLLISSTTGGTAATYTILRRLAEAAELNKIALCVGSQRIALEFPECMNFFQLRRFAPTIPLLANLGAVQLNYGINIEHCRQALEMLEADALVLHLNPLQECLQSNGNTDFSGLLGKIEQLVHQLSVPVFVKEVGWGISPQIARKLLDVGVSGIDISGSGGTSWALVESELALSPELRQLAKAFAGWGISTVSLLEAFKDWNFPGKLIIASGGVRSGIDIAKAIALGASVTGIALPFVKAAAEGQESLLGYISQLRSELTIAMFCTGSATLDALTQVRTTPSFQT